MTRSKPSAERVDLWPSIDLSEGRVVRLRRGEAGTETFYDVPAAECARRFEAEGADGIHIVDLDAAFGRGENGETVRAVIGAVRLPVQVGGGLRTRAAVEGALRDGAARVVLGSLPFADPDLFAGLLATHRERLVVALDCKDSRPTVKGWTEDAGAGDVTAVARRLAVLGVAALLVTDVARDGLLAGPNVALLRSVRGCFDGEVIASGGMRDEADVAAVDAALAGGPRGAIFGRALHEGLVSVARLVAARRQEAVR